MNQPPLPNPRKRDAAMAGLPDPEDAFLQWPPQPQPPSSSASASNGTGGADPLNALLMANHGHGHGPSLHGHGAKSKSPRLHSSQHHASYYGGGHPHQLQHHHVHDDMCTSIPHHHLFHMPPPSGPGSAGSSSALPPAASHMQYQPFSFNPAPSSYGGGMNHSNLPGASVDLHAQLLFGTEVSHSWSALGGPQPLFPHNSSTTSSSSAAAAAGAASANATADLDFLLQSLTSTTSSPAPASPVTRQLPLASNGHNSVLATVQSRGPTPSSSAPPSPSLLHLPPTSLHLVPSQPASNATDPCTATSHHHHHPGLASAPPPLPPSLTGIAPITACAAGPHSHSSSASAAPCGGAACSGHVDEDADEAERCSHAECQASGTASPAVTVSPLRVAVEAADAAAVGKADGAAAAADTSSLTTAVASKKVDGRKIGQRGKPAIIGIEQKTPGQYIHGQGDNLFIDARREDGTITCISLRSSPNRCKADLIEALNWMPEEVMLANWRYFSVLLAKIDQSKPFRRLASPQLATTAKKLRHLNPVVNVPPTALVQPMVPPAGMVQGTGEAAAAAAAQGKQHGGNAAAAEGDAGANPHVNGVIRDQPPVPPTPSASNGNGIPRSYSTSLLPSPPLQSPAPPPLPPPTSATPLESAPHAALDDASTSAGLARMLHIVSVQTRAIAELTMANRSLAGEVAGLRADVGVLARAVAQGFKAGGMHRSASG